MEKRFEISFLLDIYGNLLTEKQKYIMDLYYNNDLSLKEISELTKTSRQAIYDIIKRCDKLLTNYEDKMLLFKKSIEKDKNKKNILIDLNNIVSNINDDELKKIFMKMKKDIENL